MARSSIAGFCILDARGDNVGARFETATDFLDVEDMRHIEDAIGVKREDVFQVIGCNNANLCEPCDCPASVPALAVEWT